MKTHILTTILTATLLFCGSPLLPTSLAAEDCSACQTPLDASAILRNIELEVAKRQYEKVLTALSDAEISLQEGPPETIATPQDQVAYHAWEETQKSTIQVRERIAGRLRDRIQGIIAETNKRAEAMKVEVQKSVKREPGIEKPESLQGKWEGVEVGREADGNCTMEITSNSIHFQGANKGEWYKATYTLFAGDPAQLKATITDCPSPDFVGKSSSAIYKIEQGKLTLVGNKPGSSDAPKSFEADADSRIFVFKKAP